MRNLEFNFKLFDPANNLHSTFIFKYFYPEKNIYYLIDIPRNKLKKLKISHTYKLLNNRRNILKMLS